MDRTELIQLIQKDILFGAFVSFFGENDKLVGSGHFAGITRDFVILENNGHEKKLPIGWITSWSTGENSTPPARPPVPEPPAVAAPTPQNPPVSNPALNGGAPHPDNAASGSVPESEPAKEEMPEPEPAGPVLPEQEETPAVAVAGFSELPHELLTIKLQFDLKAQNTRLDWLATGFDLSDPEKKELKDTNGSKEWQSIRNSLNYAHKVKELDDEYGRIDPLISRLKHLSELYSEIGSFHRFLGSLYHLKKKPEEAYLAYRNAALITNEAADWLNYAGEGLLADNRKAACHGLGEYLQLTSDSGPFDENTWCLFASLVSEFGHYEPMKNVVDHYLEVEEPRPEIARLFFETGLYLLLLAGEQEKAGQYLKRQQAAPASARTLLEEMLSGFPNEPLKELATYIGTLKKPEKRVQAQALTPLELDDNEGFIYTYKRDRNFGFIRSERGDRFFFHRSAIIDDELHNVIQQIPAGERPSIAVEFEPTQGPNGPVAIKVSLVRTAEDVLKLAEKYADAGDYPKAIAQINQLLSKDPNYPEAKEKLEVWREYARFTGIPKGNTPYARAKRAHVLEKDLEKATYLFQQAIEEDDHTASAVMDLASLLNQREKPDEAIATLHKYRDKVPNQKSVDHQLIVFYQRAEQFEEAIRLLEQKLKDTPADWKKAQITWQIANVFLRIPDYEKAEKHFRNVLAMQSDNRAAKRNIAFCLFKQGDLDQAEEQLNEILSAAADQQSVNMLALIDKARLGDPTHEMEEIIIASALSDFSRETSGFTQFMLDRCDYQGVPPDRVQREAFNRRDIQHLEKRAKDLGVRRPEDRAGYFLSAAKIHSLLDDEDPRQFYSYLCRSFASKGDAVVLTQGKSLDIAREFYCEALVVYDGARSTRGDEADAHVALVRFLYSTYDQHRLIPMRPGLTSVGESLVEILNRHPDPNRVFTWVSYLIYRSRFAAERILKPIFEKSTLQAMATNYLKLKDIDVPEQINHLKDFATLWKILQRKMSERERAFSSEFQQLKKLELTTVSLDNGATLLDKLYQQLLFDLDQQRVLELQRLVKMALEMCQQSAFEDVERLCNQVIEGCEALLSEIAKDPTRISVEDIYPVVESLENTVFNRREELYEGSLPEITLGLPVPPPDPDDNRQIVLQISLNNKMGSSPAEGIELIVQEEEGVFSLIDPEIKSPASLRGGEQRILNVPLQLHEKALKDQAFSLPVYVQYRTRAGEIAYTDGGRSLSVQLPVGEFEEIYNPYAKYAEGGIVGDAEMFYGRDELIKNVSSAILAAKNETKSVVIFGQKRAGKSSIMHHLKSRLEKDEDLLIIDIGNLGETIDKNAKAPLEYIFLRKILLQLQYAIEDKIEEGKPPIKFELPSEKDFYDAHSPLNTFSEIFDKFRRSARRKEGWKKTRVVLFIDEFNYIYTYILEGSIPKSFMKTWKALLEKGYYSAVLAGQDVMPKFKDVFPNEFGTTQDERVTYLKQEDARNLIDRPIRIKKNDGTTESRYREQAINYILDLTAGSPFYIQIICNRLVEYMNRKKIRLVTQADVEQVKEELISGANSLGKDKFENLFNSGDTAEDAISDEDVLKVMTVIAQNSKTSQGQCGRHNIICETQTGIDEILEDLVKRDVLERKSGQYYSIRLGLFREWLLVHPFE